VDVRIEPLTARRWPDLVTVFGERGEAGFTEIDRRGARPVYRLDLR
jgi:hypothetical protein